MSIQSEITRLSGNVSDALTAIANKGVTIPAGSNSDDLATLIGQIQTGGGGAGAISIVDTPDAAGGTVRTITAVDISDTTAVASDVASGKYFYTADGTKTAGTASGGGGGLEYETGTWTPAEDAARGTITFANTHSLAPMYVCLIDITGTDPVASSNLWFCLTDYRKFGSGVLYNGTAYRYGGVDWGIRTTSFTTGSANITTETDTTSSSTSLYYWVTETEFHPYVSSSTRYWRSGRTYKWIAIWAPST